MQSDHREASSLWVLEPLPLEQMCFWSLGAQITDVALQAGLRKRCSEEARGPPAKRDRLLIFTPSLSPLLWLQELLHRHPAGHPAVPGSPHWRPGASDQRVPFNHRLEQFLLQTSLQADTVHPQTGHRRAAGMCNEKDTRPCVTTHCFLIAIQVIFVFWSGKRKQSSPVIFCVFTSAWIYMFGVCFVLCFFKLDFIFINNSKLLLPQAQITYCSNYE